LLAHEASGFESLSDRARAGTDIEGVGKDSRQADTLVELADGEYSGVHGKLTGPGLVDQGDMEKVEDS
jgi:hypothetical protein